MQVEEKHAWGQRMGNNATEVPLFLCAVRRGAETSPPPHHFPSFRVILVPLPPGGRRIRPTQPQSAPGRQHRCMGNSGYVLSGTPSGWREMNSSSQSSFWSLLETRKWEGSVYQNGNHIGQQSKSPQYRPTQTIRPWAYPQVRPQSY